MWWRKPQFIPIFIFSNLVRDIPPEVDGQSDGDVVRLDEISQLLAALQLLVIQPVIIHSQLYLHFIQYHLLRSSFLPCARTGLHNSSVSYLFSLPWSSRMPKYCSRGDTPAPGAAGHCWNFWIVAGVRRIPWKLSFANEFSFMKCFFPIHVEVFHFYCNPLSSHCSLTESVFLHNDCKLSVDVG